MNKEQFLKSLGAPVDDYRALRSMEKENDWSHLKQEGQLSVDVFETKDAMVIIAPVAGTKPEDLDIHVSGDTVTIRGKREEMHESQQKDFLYRECYFGNFSRTIVLPMHVKGDEADATLKNGLLTVKIPKQGKHAKIPVKHIESDF